MAANAKYVILKAKVENQIVELMVKSNVKNIYMEDGTTTLASKLTDIITDLGTKMTSEAVDTKISTAIDALIDGAPGTYDTLKEIADYLGTHQDEYTALVETLGTKASQEALDALIERVDALEDRIEALEGRADAVEGRAEDLEGRATAIETAAEELKGRVVTVETKLAGVEDGAQVNKIETIKVNGVAQAIDANKGVDIAVPTGALASKDNVAEADLATALAEKINASDAAKHTHANSAVLNGISADNVSAWDNKSNVYVQASQPTTLTANDLWFQVVEM